MKRREMAQLRRDLIRESLDTDSFAAELLFQVIALEELLCARWPGSILVRRRLRRDLRASVRHIQGEDFAGKRANTLASGWLSDPH